MDTAPALFEGGVKGGCAADLAGNVVGRGQVAVTGDAGPLCTGPVGSTGRRRSRPLRSRIKPGSTSSTLTSLIGGGGVIVTLTFSVNIYRAPHNTPVLTQYRMDTMFRLMLGY